MASTPDTAAAATAVAENSSSTNQENTGASPASSLSFYEDAENLKKLCDFLRGRHGLPVREALLMDKRVHYLKGKERE